MKIIKSYAKINLTLQVLKKLKNGMHDQKGYYYSNFETSGNDKNV